MCSIRSILIFTILTIHSALACYSGLAYSIGRDGCQSSPSLTQVIESPYGFCDSIECTNTTIIDKPGQVAIFCVPDPGAIPKPTNYVEIRHFKDVGCVNITRTDYFANAFCGSQPGFSAACNETHVILSPSCSSVNRLTTNPLHQCTGLGDGFVIASCKPTVTSQSESPMAENESPKSTTTSTAVTLSSSILIAMSCLILTLCC